MEKYLYTRNNGTYDYNLIMAYPAKEEFALSSLGYLKLFQIADTFSGINAKMINTDNPASPYKDTDSIAFSMSFDFDFLGVLEILDKNKIPFKSNERNENCPLIFAGGPVITTNPAPYKEIFDFMLIGDGENSFKKVLNVLKEKKEKKVTLKKLSEIEGVFVPSINTKVKNLSENLNDIIYTPILSDKSYFKNTFILELQRGCMNRCAFCTASYLNLPFRSCQYDKIIETIELGLNHTNKIALLGAQISAHPNFKEIISYLENKIEKNRSIELGISSLRTDSVYPDLIKTLVLGGQKNSTIAIEAASERLRKFINKNLTDEQIFNAVRICRENGLKGLKIYSMIGIPTETNEDIYEFINLAKKLKDENKGFHFTFSFSTFIPKPQTPLQWSAREDTKTLEKKQKYLEKELAKIGIETKFSSVKSDYWQTVLSRGDETFADYLIEVYKHGGKNSAFKSALKITGVNIDKAIKGFEFKENLPWDIVENSVKKDYLKNEFERLSKKADI